MSLSSRQRAARGASEVAENGNETPGYLNPPKPRNSLPVYFRFYPIVWIIFLIFNPVYIFPSGSPQPSDGLMAVMILTLATGYVIRLPIYKNLYFAASLFLGYLAIVNLYWYAFYFDRHLLLSTLYYAYNFGVVLVVISMMAKYGTDFVTVTRIALATAVAIELVACLVGPAGGLRTLGTFNNPNQLGYWCLLMLACWLVLKDNQRLSTLDFLIMGATGYLVALALSKAALLAFGLLVLFGIIGQGMQKRGQWSAAVLAVAAVPILVSQPAIVERFLETEVASNVAKRMDNIGQQEDDSLAGRGYDRLWRYPQHVILGSGEGAYQRFDVAGGFGAAKGEIHSTFGTLLFSYGIIGLALFGFVIYQFFHQSPIKHLAYFLPVCAYGLTHQGLRFTIFWVFLALVFGLGVMSRRSSRGQHRATRAAPPGKIYGDSNGGTRL